MAITKNGPGRNVSDVGGDQMSDRQAVLDFDLNAIDLDFIEDPHPMLSLLRRHDPVHWNPDGSVYLTRYEDVQKVYQDRQ